MAYLIAEIWVTLLLALALGVAVGWVLHWQTARLGGARAPEAGAASAGAAFRQAAAAIKVASAPPRRTEPVLPGIDEDARPAELRPEDRAAAERLQEENAALAAALAEANAARAEAAERIAALEVQGPRDESDRAEAGKRQLAIDNELQRLRHAADQAIRERNEMTQRLGVLNSEFMALRQSAGAQDQARMQLQQRVAGLEAELTGSRTSLNAAEAEKQRLMRRIASLEAELDRARTGLRADPGPGRAGPKVGVRPLGLTEARGEADEFQLLAGMDAATEAALNKAGIFHFWQIAEWTPDNVAWINATLGAGGRTERERWVEQARTLVNDGYESFRRRFRPDLAAAGD